MSAMLIFVAVVT